jgi:hypothetical protein
MDNIPFVTLEGTNQSVFPFPELDRSVQSVDSGLLEIDGEIISIERGLAYLKNSGELPKFLLEITRQYLLEKEVRERAIAEPSLEVLEQFILELRMQQGLTTIDKFQTWLASQGLTYHDFREKMKFLIQIETCQTNITEPQLESYFLEQQKNLEKLVLSRIVVDSSQVAQDLKDKLEKGSVDFPQLAKEYSIVDDAVIGGALGSVSRRDLPKEIALSLENCTAGQIIGPLVIETRYCLLKVEEIIPAQLDNSLKQALEIELFNQWLKKRIQSANLQVLLSENKPQ